MTPSTKDTSSFELQKWPFYWLTQASSRYLAVLEQTLREIDLDVPTWRALMLLGDGTPRSVSYLSKEAITKLSTMTRIVQRMQEAGLVRTHPSPSDARVTEVELTANGNRARILAWQSATKIFDRTFEGVPESRIDQMRRDLATLARLLSERHST